MSDLLISAINWLIQLVETIRYRDSYLDSEDPSKKIIDSFRFDKTTWLVKVKGGWGPISQVHLTQPYEPWRLRLQDGKTLMCADDHQVINLHGEKMLVKYMINGDMVLTENSYCMVDSVMKMSGKRSMYDLSVETAEHSYFADGILSHNTVMTSVFITHYLIFNKDRNVMVLANVGRTMEELIDKIKVIMSNVPFFMKPGVIVNNVKSMKFDNGCRLFGMPTTKNAGIGFAVHLLYMDEFAHIHPNFIDFFWKSAYPTISSSHVSKVIITSTPNGTNKFYELYTAALQGENDFHPIRIDWWQVPGRDEAWKQKEIKNLGSEEDFNQEYGNQFLSSSRLLLDPKTMQMMKNSAVEYVHETIDGLEDLEIDYQNLKWHPKFKVNEVEGGKFVFSIDLSEGVGRDYHVVNIFKLIPTPKSYIEKMKDFDDESDFFSLLQVGMFRHNRCDVDTVASIVSYLLYEVFGEDNVAIVLEMNYDGQRFTDKLEKDDRFYDEILVHSLHSENSKHVKPGIKVRNGNKKAFCSNSKRLIRLVRIILTEINTYNEMSNFGINDKGTYSSQIGNDDIAATCVNLTTYFESEQFSMQVEEYFDELQDDIKTLIQSKLSTNGDEDDYDPEEGWGLLE